MSGKNDWRVDEEARKTMTCDIHRRAPYKLDSISNICSMYGAEDLPIDAADRTAPTCDIRFTVSCCNDVYMQHESISEMVYKVRTGMTQLFDINPIRVFIDDTNKTLHCQNNDVPRLCAYKKARLPRVKVRITKRFYAPVAPGKHILVRDIGEVVGGETLWGITLQPEAEGRLEVVKVVKAYTSVIKDNIMQSIRGKSGESRIGFLLNEKFDEHGHQNFHWKNAKDKIYIQNIPRGWIEKYVCEIRMDDFVLAHYWMELSEKKSTYPTGKGRVINIDAENGKVTVKFKIVKKTGRNTTKTMVHTQTIDVWWVVESTKLKVHDYVKANMTKDDGTIENDVPGVINKLGWKSYRISSEIQSELDTEKMDDKVLWAEIIFDNGKMESMPLHQISEKIDSASWKGELDFGDVVDTHFPIQIETSEKEKINLESNRDNVDIVSNTDLSNCRSDVVSRGLVLTQFDENNEGSYARIRLENCDMIHEIPLGWLSKKHFRIDTPSFVTTHYPEEGNLNAKSSKTCTGLITKVREWDETITVVLQNDECIEVYPWWILKSEKIECGDRIRFNWDKVTNHHFRSKMEDNAGVIFEVRCDDYMNSRMDVHFDDGQVHINIPLNYLSQLFKCEVNLTKKELAPGRLVKAHYRQDLRAKDTEISENPIHGTILSHELRRIQDLEERCCRPGYVRVRFDAKEVEAFDRAGWSYDERQEIPIGWITECNELIDNRFFVISYYEVEVGEGSYKQNKKSRYPQPGVIISMFTETGSFKIRFHDDTTQAVPGHYVVQAQEIKAGDRVRTISFHKKSKGKNHRDKYRNGVVTDAFIGKDWVTVRYDDDELEQSLPRNWIKEIFGRWCGDKDADSFKPMGNLAKAMGQGSDSDSEDSREKSDYVEEKKAQDVPLSNCSSWSKKRSRQGLNWGDTVF